MRMIGWESLLDDLKATLVEWLGLGAPARGPVDAGQVAQREGDARMLGAEGLFAEGQGAPRKLPPPQTVSASSTAWSSVQAAPSAISRSRALADSASPSPAQRRS
jgi:hypothetical protein